MMASSMNKNKIYSAYVKYPPDLELEIVKQLLQVVGPFNYYKPTLDSTTQKPKNFGFVEYTDVSIAANTLELLNTSLTLNPWVFRFDRNSDALITAHIRSKIDDGAKDKFASERQKISQILQQYLKSSEISNTNQSKTQSDQSSNDLKSALTNDQKDDEEDGQIDDTQSLSKLSNNQYENEEDGDVKELAEREQNRKKEMLKLYNQRLSKWKEREQYKLKLKQEYDQIQLKMKETELKREQLKVYLQEYDDDQEEEKGQDLWFSDRDQWIKQRKPIKDEELQKDEVYFQ